MIHRLQVKVPLNGFHDTGCLRENLSLVFSHVSVSLLQNNHENDMKREQNSSLSWFPWGIRRRPKYIIVRMSNPRSRVPADQAINGEIFVVPKGFIMDLSQDVSSQVDVSVAACFLLPRGKPYVSMPFFEVGRRGVGRGGAR